SPAASSPSAWSAATTGSSASLPGGSRAGSAAGRMASGSFKRGSVPAGPAAARSAAILARSRKPPNPAPDDDRTHLPGTDCPPRRVLGGAGLRADPAVGPGGRRRHLPPGHLPARAGARAVERGLRAAFAPPHRRPLRREPQPPAALLPVPGGDEAQSRQHRRAVLRLAEGTGHRPAGARPAPGRGQLGIADARRLGPGLGGLAQ